MARELRALGAEVIEFPTIEMVAPDSYATLDASIAPPTLIEWWRHTLVFAGRNVQHIRRLPEYCGDLTGIGPFQAKIGEQHDHRVDYAALGIRPTTPVLFMPHETMLKQRCRLKYRPPHSRGARLQISSIVVSSAALGE